MSNEDEVEAMYAKAIAEFGTLHISVSNAGLQADSPLTTMTLDQWNKVISINLTGQFLCQRAAAREFLKRGVVKDVSLAAGKMICMSLGAPADRLGGPRATTPRRRAAS